MDPHRKTNPESRIAGVYRRSIFKIRPNILIGLQKLRLRPKDQSRSRLFIYLIFLRQFSYFYPISTNVSSVVEFLKWWVLKSKIFGQESTYSKDLFFKESVDELWLIKKCQNCTFKVNFWCQKSTEFFQ